jgi:hypothetical protein
MKARNVKCSDKLCSVAWHHFTDISKECTNYIVKVWGISGESKQQADGLLFLG